MIILRIEHPVPNFDSWKKMGFDNDPLNREKSGVRRHQILRPVDNSNYVMIDLSFGSQGDAEAMLEKLKVMWGNVSERFGWTEHPKAVITEVAEEKDYERSKKQK
jgi:hypothetical protein